ncbi:MAG: hypothetical protein PHW25_05785 [Zoogloea sp.]|uniref:hypothetical protein n=1 Tax=Zoogloea sp. TaxID=49181 RepID=UPI002617F04C|nr:hypothetical protein [Zoogloea sp.]MDD3326582.1 hypothetical protein [Zoogloea sp.]
MQMPSAFRATLLPDPKTVIASAQALARAVGEAVVRPVKALGSRMTVVMAKPWFFPAQVVAFLAVLWLQQHGYLQVPITVCDWIGVGK